MPRGRGPVYPSPCSPSFSLSYLCGLPQSLRSWEGRHPEFSLIGYFPVLGLEGKLAQILSVCIFQPWVPTWVLGFFWLLPQGYASVSLYWRLDNVF